MVLRRGQRKTLVLQCVCLGADETHVFYNGFASGLTTNIGLTVQNCCFVFVLLKGERTNCGFKMVLLRG